MFSMISLVISLSILGGAYVDAHEFLNLTIAANRVCPYVNIINYRLSTFLNAVQDLTSDHYIYSPFEFESFDQTNLWESALNESFQSSTFASISFPKKIYPVTNYFTHQQLIQGTIDTSDQSLWYSMDAVLNGGNPFISTPYGDENELSLHDFLVSSLGFDVVIIPGVGSYVCDDENAWGMTKATVNLKEDDQIYVGTAQLITTHTIDEDDEDNWYMTSCAIYWDIQRESSNDESELSVTDTTFYSIIGCIIFVLLCGLVILGYLQCKNKGGEASFANTNTELMAKNGDKNKNTPYKTFDDD